MHLKAKNSPHTTQISSFKYVFIVFCSQRKTDAKIYIYFHLLDVEKSLIEIILEKVNCWFYHHIKKLTILCKHTSM